MPLPFTAENVLLCRRILRKWLRQRGWRVPPPLFDDLVQEAALRLVQTNWNRAEVPIPWKTVVGAAINFLKREWSRYERELAACHLRRAERRSGERLSRLEYHELRDKAVGILLERDTTGHDAVVFALWLEGDNTLDISGRCPWLANASTAEAALVRIFRLLREEFGEAEGDAISLRQDRRRRTDQLTGYRSIAQVRAYNHDYYLAHREQMIRAAGEARRARRQRRQARATLREAIHTALLAAGYTRYALADSGASSYYVHPTDFRVRVSDHAPHSVESSELVRRGQMILIDLGQPDITPASVVVACEAARQNFNPKEDHK